MDTVTNLPSLTPGPQTACLRADPMMERRTFLGTLGLSVLAAPLASEAQQTRKIPRVGVLGGQSPEDSPAPPILALRQGLRELGYVEAESPFQGTRDSTDFSFNKCHQCSRLTLLPIFPVAH